jgi:hypothetical protein
LGSEKSRDTCEHGLRVLVTYMIKYVLEWDSISRWTRAILIHMNTVIIYICRDGRNSKLSDSERETDKKKIDGLKHRPKFCLLIIRGIDIYILYLYIYIFTPKEYGGVSSSRFLCACPWKPFATRSCFLDPHPSDSVAVRLLVLSDLNSLEVSMDQMGCRVH